MSKDSTWSQPVEVIVFTDTPHDGTVAAPGRFTARMRINEQGQLEYEVQSSNGTRLSDVRVEQVAANALRFLTSQTY